MMMSGAIHTCLGDGRNVSHDDDLRIFLGS